MVTGSAGKRVLLVEDEAILAMCAEDILVHLGFVVIGPALSTSDAQKLASTEQLDAAVLDVNMGDANSFEVADTLVGRKIAFCFCTGYGRAGVPDRFDHVPVLPKPYSESSLSRILNELGI